MKVLWQAWYGDLEIDLEFPATWLVEKVQMADAAQADPATLADSLRQPIGTPTLEELARESRTAAIAVEDITRPSPLGQIAQLIVAELKAGGLKAEQIRFIMGLGAHTPMRRQELIKKLGREIVEDFPNLPESPAREPQILGRNRTGNSDLYKRFLLGGCLVAQCGHDCAPWPGRIRRRRQDGGSRHGRY